MTIHKMSPRTNHILFQKQVEFDRPGERSPE